jgi:hypothetical protein
MKFKFFEVYKTTENMLENSVRNNTRFYYIMLFVWAGILLYANAYKDVWLMLSSFIFLIGGVHFALVRKIDSMRLELIRK